MTVFDNIEAAETLCMICVSPEEHIFRKNYLGNRPFKQITFYKGFTGKLVFLQIF